MIAALLGIIVALLLAVCFALGAIRDLLAEIVGLLDDDEPDDEPDDDDGEEAPWRRAS